MSKLHTVSEACARTQIGSVVFIHGLGGDAVDTWRNANSQDAFWPKWLADDLKNANVYSFGYDAAPSAWLGSTMPLFDRAKQLLAWMETIPDSPIVFVCHSMGGILVKKALQWAKEGANATWHNILQRTKGVAFFATPHTGSELGDTMARLGKVLRATVSIEELRRNAPNLRELNEWYRNNATQLGIVTTSFYETRPIAGVLVVDESSADPGIPGAALVPLDANHISITKPENRSSLQHIRLRTFLRHCFDTAATAKTGSLPKESRDISAGNNLKLVISYKRGIARDEQLARAIYGEMKALGHDVFMDVDMAIGADWAAEIRKRIGQCDYLIVLLSAQAAGSEMVQAEVRLAHHHRKRDNKPIILPIRLAHNDLLDYELDAILGRTQFIHWQDDRDTNRVISALTDHITEGQPPKFRSSLSFDQLNPIVTPPSSTVAIRPTSSRDPRVLLPPGGSLKSDDPFYVRRVSDQQIDALSKFRGQTVCIKAPRQMGKSSILVRYMTLGKAIGKHFIWIDFQSFSEAELSDFQTFLSSFAQILARQFHFEFHGDLSFRNQGDITRFVEDKLLADTDAPVVLGLDEVDRLLGRPYQSDFFSMLRLWHNARALPVSPWERVDLALVIATEPYLLIAEADRSPFNVTPPIELRPFSRVELDTLNAAYGFLLDVVQLDQLYELLSGHPYLTRLAYYRLLSCSGLTFVELMESSANNNGPFGEHLRSKLFQLQQYPGLLAAMRRLCSRSARLDGEPYYRLHGAGLVERREALVFPANQLYAKFFNQLR